MKKYKIRRIIVGVFVVIGLMTWLILNPSSYDAFFVKAENSGENFEIDEPDDGGQEKNDENNTVSDGNIEENKAGTILAIDLLGKLEVKGRAPKAGYSRDEFYGGWPSVEGCSLRQRILKRELGESAVLEGCNVVAGEFDEPYTGEHMVLVDKSQVSKIQIDHVVALSDAWQKGAQYMDKMVRYNIATDPLNLLAVDGAANKQKSDGDAATWLPKNKKFRCQYVARQVSVKYKYKLWVTEAEKEAINNVLEKCPKEPAIGV